MKNYTVKLNKVVVGKTGNIYYPGIYTQANPLPEYLMTDENIMWVEGKEENANLARKENENTSATIKQSKNFAPIEELEIKNVNPPAVKVEEFEIKSEKVEPQPSKLNINEAKIEDIVALDGIGKGTAKKVIAYRESSAFVNYSDLNERIPLAFGRDWKDFNLEF